MKTDIKKINEALRAKGDRKRNGFELPAEAIQSAKKALRDATILHSEVKNRAAVEKLVSKR